MSRSPTQLAKLRAMGITVWQSAARGPAPASPVAGDPPDAAALPTAVQAGARSASPTPAQAAPPAPIRAAPPARAQTPAPAATPAQAVAALPAAGAAPQPAFPGTATDADIAALDWPALQQRVADCRACGLCQGRSQTVFGIGHPRAHWMIVGEAPGEHEDLQGEPFVGPSGQLLDRMLQALGLTRQAAAPAQQVYIANTLKCRPPRNRNPAPDELLRCLPYLQRQVALVQPRVILAMGRFAIEALTGSSEPVGRLRGQIHAWHGTPVVATYHPSYLLRSPAEKAKSWADLCLAASVVSRAG